VVARDSEDEGDAAHDVAEHSGVDNYCIADDYCKHEKLQEAVVVLE
jgi:hypothetical protein